MASEPTERQLEILNHIHEFISLHGISPSRRDVGALSNIKSTNGVNDVLMALSKKGAITYSTCMARSIQLTAKGRALVGCVDTLSLVRALWAIRHESSAEYFETRMTELLEGPRGT